MSALFPVVTWVRAALLLLAGVAVPPLAQAQQVASPKRLSSYLAEQSLSPDAYRIGLSWRVPSETPAQLELKMELLGSLRDGTSTRSGAHRLASWLASMPVTGRVPVPLADERWLEVAPARDPVLLPGHTVVVPRRPRTVTVVGEAGELCRVPHLPGREASAYVLACVTRGTSRFDWVWIAQPDGRVQRFGVALWNRQEQDEPAPGAWIWSPSRSAGVPPAVSEKLMAFLATQGPAPDEPARTAASADAVADLPSLSAYVAPGQTGRSRDPVVTNSNWGNAGLMQTPSARMARTGHFSFNFSKVYPYSIGNVFIQPLDWLEFGFRYIDVGTRPYGPADVTGTQTYKDKSVDLKFRLMQESAYLPELALGLRDASGTGLFAGEYVVANKRFGTLDFSLGLGWGYLGGRGNLRNPLSSLLGKGYDDRSNSFGQGGSFSFKSFFRGRTSVFGGVQMQLPWEHWLLKLEYDGNDYRNEPLANPQPQRSPWNVGLVYRAGRAVDLTLGVERGNVVMFNMSLQTDLDTMSTLKLADPPRVPVSPLRPQVAPDWNVTGRDVANQTGWHVARIDQAGRELRVTIEEAEAVYWRERVDKAAAVLHRDAPADVERFTFLYRQHSLDVATHVVNRDAWVEQRTEPIPAHRIGASVYSSSAQPGTGGKVLYRNALQNFESGLGFSYQQTLGGPDGFILFQLGAAGRAKWRVRDDTWIEGVARLGIVDNYDKFRYTAPSNLPRVRTFMREYLTTSRMTMPNLQATHVGRLGGSQYYSVYAGYLEEMFAGVGGEWLYRPHASRIAVGIDVNAVQQRNFRQDFSLRDYKVLTGHVTLYWDTGWKGVNVMLAAGRYLAKDFGATLLLSRTFDNGVSVGAFATKTNVSAATFGEGSFDKGVFVTIPFDAFLAKSSSSVGNFLWKPLTRDGGARLGRITTLYDLTNVRDERALRATVAPRPNEDIPPVERRDAKQPESREAPASMGERPRVTPAGWIGSADERRLEEALVSQSFRDVAISLDGTQRLTVIVANERVYPISRAVGRAVRSALRFGPMDMREIRVIFNVRGMPGVTYEFVDLNRLERYLRADLARAQLVDYVSVKYSDPSLRESDPLARLDDTTQEADKFQLTTVLPVGGSVARVGDDVLNAGKAVAKVDWIHAGTWGLGLTLASAIADKHAFTYSRDHLTGVWAKRAIKAGDSLPWIGLAGAAILALDGSDPVRSRTAVAATEAGASGILLATGLKYLVGRARPDQGLGATSFKPFSATGYDSFPSRHAITAWAVATPFAKEYDALWLYGVAALSNLSRVVGKNHWVSDTVASAALGYGLGMLFWEANSASRGKGEPRVMVNPAGVKLAWEFQ